MDIGFVGLGRMGNHICRHLLESGHAVSVYDIRPEAVAAMEPFGGAPCAGPGEAASGAEAGTLTLMVGGSASGFERLRPLLEPFGKNIFHCGGPGMGMLFKVVNNMLSHVNLAALAEAMALGVAAGADPELLTDVIAVSSGRSRQVQDRLRKHILAGDFTPGMTTDLATKDSDLCLELARELRIPTFIASASHHVYEMAIQKGYGPDEYASLIKLWEEWLGIEVRAGGREEWVRGF